MSTLRIGRNNLTERKAPIVHSFLIVATVIVIIYSLCLIGAIYNLYLRPHRSRIFFSYSHKDSEIARRVMKYLKQYHFRTWVDFGKTIEPASLECELAAAIKPTEVLVLLSSDNALNSRWVDFELLRATDAGKLGYRDITILALDDSGLRLQKSLRGVTAEQKKENADVLKALAENDNWVFRALLRGEFFGKAQPRAKRLFDRQVSLFDLRLPFSEVMGDVAKHLKHQTKLLPMRRAFGCVHVLMIMFWLLGCIALTTIWRMYYSINH